MTYDPKEEAQQATEDVDPDAHLTSTAEPKGSAANWTQLTARELFSQEPAGAHAPDARKTATLELPENYPLGRCRAGCNVPAPPHNGIKGLWRSRTGPGYSLPEFKPAKVHYLFPPPTTSDATPAVRWNVPDKYPGELHASLRPHHPA